MQFTEGQTVVHPHHGPATITQIADRTFGKVTRRYLRLQVKGSDLDVAIPLDTAEELGIRSVIGDAELQELFDTLHAPTGPQETAWSRRFKENRERLRVGDLLMTAGVARDLGRRQQEQGVSMGEREMLREARKPIATEIALVMSVDEERAEELIDEAVLGDGVDVAEAIEVAS